MGRWNVLYWRDFRGGGQYFFALSDEKGFQEGIFCSFWFDAYFRLGIFFGRFGNFLNQELYGIPLAELPDRLGQFFSSLGLWHYYPKVDGLLRVNTNFISMALEGILLFMIQVLVFFGMIRKKERKVWSLATNFLLFYSLIRFWLEYLRADSQLEFIGFFTKSQRFFLGFMGIALVLKWFLRREQHLSLLKA